MSKSLHHKSQTGFSLIELLVAMGLITVIMGAIFSQIIQAQQYSTAEQSRVDMFQEAREFIDQMSRDLRTTGYPNTHNFNTDGSYTDQAQAVGLVRLDPGNLWFEASVDGSGAVYVIRYHLNTACTPRPCLMRSQALKVPGDPIAPGGQPEADQTELQYVMLPSNDVTQDPIFKAYDVNGNLITSSDFSCNGTSPSPEGNDCTPATVLDAGGNPVAMRLANINSVAVKITVQSPFKDRSGSYPAATLVSTVRLNNCSRGYTNTSNSVMGCL